MNFCASSKCFCLKRIEREGIFSRQDQKVNKSPLVAKIQSSAKVGIFKQRILLFTK
jgi:hypothetical protein